MQLPKFSSIKFSHPEPNRVILFGSHLMRFRGQRIKVVLQHYAPEDGLLIYNRVLHIYVPVSLNAATEMSAMTTPIPWTVNAAVIFHQ